MVLEPKAAEMFAAGATVNAVAEALYKRAWARAKKQHAAWLAATGGAPVESRPKRGGRKKTAAPETEAEVEEVPESFDMGLIVPTEKLDPLIATFTVQEKAYAVAQVIQSRMDALLEA